MPIDAYLSGLERVTKEIDTRRFEFHQFYLKGIELLRDAQGLIDSHKFSEQFSNIVDVVYNGFAQRAKEYFKIPEETMKDDIKAALIGPEAYIGLTRDAIAKSISRAIQKTKDILNADAIVKAAGKYLSPIYQKISNAVMNRLKPDDAASVIAYVDRKNEYKLDPANEIFKAPHTLADLLNHFNEAGVLTPRYAASRPEIFKQAAKADSGLVVPHGGRLVPASAVA